MKEISTYKRRNFVKKEMNLKEYINMLIRQLKKYYNNDVFKSIKINKHMNNYDGEVIKEETLKAILVDFVNFLAAEQGVDLALYTRDLKKKDNL